MFVTKALKCLFGLIEILTEVKITVWVSIGYRPTLSRGYRRPTLSRN
jgi:hypothetical protein